MIWLRAVIAPLLILSASAIGPLSKAAFAETLELTENQWDKIPVVLSATRLETEPPEVPASVTIIDRDLMSALGVHRIEELFRFVPGMQVGYEHGYQGVVTYHGMTDEWPRRLQVLVNGRSIYQPALARILWSDIPLPLALIQRIEIIRGPNTASYGANAFLAIINIVTEHPKDLVGWYASFQTNKHNFFDATVGQTFQINNWAVNLTLNRQIDNGYALTETGLENHDDQNKWSVRLDAAHDSGGNTWRIQAGLKTGDKTAGPIEAEVTPYHLINTDYRFVQINRETNSDDETSRSWQFFINQHDTEERWDVCLPRLMLTQELFTLFEADAVYTEQLLNALATGTNPPPPSADIAPLALAVINRALTDGATLTCGEANQDVFEQRIDFEWQQRNLFSPSLRSVFGINIRRDEVTAESFFRGTEDKTMARSFAHIEWRPADDIIVNAGANWEYDSLTGTDFSPRLGVNHRLSSELVWRFVVSQATRTPDLFESLGYRTYTVRRLTPPLPGNQTESLYYQHAAQMESLGVERVTATEIGFNYRADHAGIAWDIRVFDEDFEHLIEGPTQVFDFNLTDRGFNHQRGAEGQIDWRPNADWRLWMVASYLDTVGRSSIDYDDAIPKWSGAVLVVHDLDPHWRLSFAATSHATWFRQTLTQAQFRAIYQTRLSTGWHLEVSAGVNKRYDAQWYFDTNNRFDDSSLWTVQLKLSQF